jgi:hypothetical protein
VRRFETDLNVTPLAHPTRFERVTFAFGAFLTRPTQKSARASNVSLSY